MGTDVLIIGGGVIGLSIARELNKRGVRRIMVIDKGRIGGEASWAAAGMLAANAETRIDDPFFRMCVESNRLYPQFAAELLEETGIDIELDTGGTLCLAFTEREEADLAEKFAWQTGAGIRVQPLEAGEIREREPAVSSAARCALRYEDDHQVENRKLVAALRKYCEIEGVELVEGVQITGLLIEKGVLLGAASRDVRYTASKTVIAAGAWTTELARTMPSLGAVKPIRGQMISFAPPERFLHSVVYTSEGYLVPRNDGRILAGATVEDAGFDKCVTADAISQQKAMAVRAVPRLGGVDVGNAWCGLRPLADGGYPVIGWASEIRNAYIATGHYRNGILLAPLTGRIAAEQMLDGSRSPEYQYFAPRDAAMAGNAAAAPSNKP